MKFNYPKLFVLNYIYILVLEFVFKFGVLKTYDIGILYILILSLPIALFFTFLMSLFKKSSINRVISFLIWIILFFIAAAEVVYYSFYKTICGLSAIVYGGQVMDFVESIIEHIFSNIVLIGIMFIPLLILMILSITKRIKHEKFFGYETIALAIGMFSLIYGSFSLTYEESINSKKIFMDTNDLMESTNRFGINTAVIMDAIKLVIGFEENMDIVNRLPFTKDEKLEYNVTNIDFDSLIENTKDKTLKDMHNYFKGESPTDKNKYSGVFSGKNVIFITAEAFYPIGVDKELTPTLYKLVNNGFIFNNYYQPIYNCSTSDGEFINTLSILPGVKTCSMKATSDTYLPYSLGNIMREYDYNTYAFHGWTYSYYGRDKTHTNLGYDYYGYDTYKTGFKNALKGISYSWPTSDIDVVNSSYDVIDKSKNFVAYYMSISGHLAYNFTGGNAIALKNKDAVKNLDAPESIKAYIATQIEFDKSLELLMDKLESDGILDDTVIVISADHYPYGLSNKDIASYVDWMKDDNFDLYKNNLVIYNSAMENVEVDKYTSSLDVLPTLLNMLGVKYDSRLLIGKDIFSSVDDLVIFNNKSWITNKGRYDYLSKKFEPFNGEEVDREYIDNINDIVSLKFQISKLLISKDYYRIVLGE